MWFAILLHQGVLACIRASATAATNYSFNKFHTFGLKINGVVFYIQFIIGAVGNNNNSIVGTH